MSNIDRVLSTISNLIRSFKGKIDILPIISLPDEQSGITFEKFMEEIIFYCIFKDETW